MKVNGNFLLINVIYWEINNVFVYKVYENVLYLVLILIKYEDI